jgi:hypothetical protein
MENKHVKRGNSWSQSVGSYDEYDKNWLQAAYGKKKEKRSTWME